MPHAQRENGVIISLFASEQPSIQTEWLEEDDPEVLAFRNPPLAPIADRVEQRLVNDVVLLALIRRTAKAEGITERALLDEIRAEAKEVLSS